MNNLQRELNQMSFLSDLSLENDKFKYFIKHLDQDVSRKCLVAESQDSHFSEIRCNNLREGDVDLQIKLAKLHSELSSKQQLQLGVMLGLAIDSVNERTDNEEVCAFANINTTKKINATNLFRQQTIDNDECPFTENSM